MKFKLFKKREAKLMTPEVDINGDKRLRSDVTTPNRCLLCGNVPTMGRGGERIIKFVSGETITAEIVNESNVPGKMCYTLYLMDDPELGWVEMPIRCCPRCGKVLRKKGTR